ncbi:uncharacterized protein LOC144366537 [Ictidomys tridecemlineatus]
MLLMFNYSSPLLNCSNQMCRLVQCWNASLEDSVVVVRVPSYLPLPVSIDDDNLPVLLQRNKRDLDITAAIVAAVAASAVAAATATAALATAVLTADAVNKLADTAATAMETQTMMNQHLHRGIVLLNQRVDLLQDQVDILNQVLMGRHACTGCGPSTCHWIVPVVSGSYAQAAAGAESYACTSLCHFRGRTVPSSMAHHAQVIDTAQGARQGTALGSSRFESQEKHVLLHVGLMSTPHLHEKGISRNADSPGEAPLRSVPLFMATFAQWR